MAPHPDTIRNQIFYLAYRYQLRDMIFEWEGKPFNPNSPEGIQILQSASLEVLQKILEKYRSKQAILDEIADDIIFRQKQIIRKT